MSRIDLSRLDRRISRSTQLGAVAILALGGCTGTARPPVPRPAALSPSGVASPRTASTALAFVGVTVIDVTDGRLLPAYTVVIVGNRVQAVGPADNVRVPQGAQVVNAEGQYLIPGLWDMHVHIDYPDAKAHHPLLIANGVTGIREAGTKIPLDTLLYWRREIAAGMRIGPRQIVAGPSLKGRRPAPSSPDEAVRLVDSLKTAGADFIKVRALPREIYFALAAEARRLGIPLEGHLPHLPPAATPIEASDSGARIIDHPYGLEACMGPSSSVATCTPLAERFIHNGTWVVPTLVYMTQTQPDSAALPTSLSVEILQRTGIGILAGTDAHAKILPGPSLHRELRLLVQGGLTPLGALQAATVNPAQMLRATDSLGTVAPGKLADLVLLDANPLVDIKNTTKIRAVVANGRYFDRLALDAMRFGRE